MKRLLQAILFLSALHLHGQATLTFAVNDINALLQSGACSVEHSLFDIGSIHDVFDHDPQTLARSANINPMVITLSFPFKVNFSGSGIIESYGNGWWTLEVADTKEDLDAKSGSYVLLFNQSPLSDAVYTEHFFTPQSKKIIRLIVQRTTGDNYVHLPQWDLLNAYAEVEIQSLCARPTEIFLHPGTSTELKLYGKSTDNRLYEINDQLLWSNQDPLLFNYTESTDGLRLHAFDSIGIGMLNAHWQSLDIMVPIHIANNFKSKIAVTREVKVALVIIDPPVVAENGLRFHQRFGWDDPHHLTNALIDSLNATSGGVVDYQIVSEYDEDSLYTSFQGTGITIDSLYTLFLEPGWATFHHLEQIGGFQFDYNGLLNAHNFCTLSNDSLIDEVWVYSMPFLGMYESRLTGKDAFWYNSPPLDGNDCINQLPVMGFNYERGVAEAMHSFGHRVESAMAHTFGRWDYAAVDKNDWEIFTLYDKVAPGMANCGNIHYPPNAISDYDYGNTTDVIVRAENWEQYPFLFNDFEINNCQRWDCSQLGFMSWWFRHLPHFNCKNKDGIWNNWWEYIVNYNEGKSHEVLDDACSCNYAENIVAIKDIAGKDGINVFPNPVRDAINIDFEKMDGHVSSVQLFNANGILVKSQAVLFNSKMSLDIMELPAGTYFLAATRADGTRFIIKPVIVLQ